MPRKHFISDLQQAKSNKLPANLQSLEDGQDDGQFTFRLVASEQETYEITAIVPDVSEYPEQHEYMIFCADDAPKQLADHVQKIKGTKGKTITQLLEHIASHISSRYTSEQQSQTTQRDEEHEDFDDADLTDISDDDDDQFHTGAPLPARSDRSNQTRNPETTTLASRNRVRSDLRAIKAAGFHVGIIGDIIGGASCYLSISVRVAKLGISEEAMQAWQVDPAEYFVLMIRYPAGYETLDAYCQRTSNRHSTVSNIDIRVVCSEHKKPLAQDVVRAFQIAGNEEMEKTAQAERLDHACSSIHDTFVSKSLISLIDEHFVPLVKLRSSGMTWLGAERYYDIYKTSHEPADVDSKDVKYFQSEPPSTTLPGIVTADHLAANTIANASMPLVMMQLILRHFVRCVEFCIICHRKIDNGLEAIKPYVCDKPLCLYQYLTFGFGPSIEHEIMAQPRVVDLLISFCYNAADAEKLQDPPLGLNIKVPYVDVPLSHYRPPNRGIRYSYEPEPPAPPRESPATTAYRIDYDCERGVVIFQDKIVGGCPVARATWIAIKLKNDDDVFAGVLHCRVLGTSFFPEITVEPPIAVSHTPYFKANEKQASTRYEDATLHLYNVDLESLDKAEQCRAIASLLDTLPSVEAMRKYLEQSSSSTPDLRKWTQRITPSALLILRWIIASNRACIMQLDEKDDTSILSSTSKGGRQDRELISGMPGFVQFRFAMGAPDKEYRFLSAVEQTTKRLSLQHPTAFAWHGSPLHNWHDIIRQGLHFKRIDHGRAYGNGVYHALDALTSLGYTAGSTRHWPNSALQVNTAMALNELVNARSEYVSSSPYLVVAQLDWIQTRYLLVKCGSMSNVGSNIKVPHVAFQHDTHTKPRGVGGVHIGIPAAAIKSTRLCPADDGQTIKRFKCADGTAVITNTTSEYESEESDDEEGLLRPEEDNLSDSFAQAFVDRSVKAVSKHDFVPGSLDFKTLPLLPLPSYATSVTTRRLMSELKTMQKALDTTPASELGWWMAVDKVDNVYQWIVELHSFHTFEIEGRTIPLADDMKRRDIKSIVLEIRFDKDFPYSPPFLRVVRPRFKTFNEGGGGHVVMGGAMCMELLTNTGWSSISSMESVLLQVRLAIASKPYARLDTRSRDDYGTAEAADGFMRACRAHGWVIPPGFRDLAYGIDHNKRLT